MAGSLLKQKLEYLKVEILKNGLVASDVHNSAIEIGNSFSSSTEFISRHIFIFASLSSVKPMDQ